MFLRAVLDRDLTGEFQWMLAGLLLIDPARGFCRGALHVVVNLRIAADDFVRCLIGVVSPDRLHGWREF